MNLDEMDTPALVAHLAGLLQAQGRMMATAESCTGGLIAGACTDLAGSSAWFELLACMVARHKWPVSAKAMAKSIVSRSRISPIWITSGAWRSVFFNAMPQLSVSEPMSRCVIRQLRCGWMYSTGSSIVMMWP